jgi:hypothetical protein
VTGGGSEFDDARYRRSLSIKQRRQSPGSLVGVQNARVVIETLVPAPPFIRRLTVEVS